MSKKQLLEWLLNNNFELYTQYMTFNKAVTKEMNKLRLELKEAMIK